jgi:hypothetical protein
LASLRIHADDTTVPVLAKMKTVTIVAVITRRPDAPRGCSPYILFEYGLALEAQKTAFVFVEQG